MNKLLLLIALLIGSACFAKVPLPQKHTYVNDFAHLLTSKQIKLINKRIRALENKTSAQLAVVLINRLPADYTIEDYATLLGRKWKVGNKGKGLVYVLSVKDRKQRLEVADGMLKYIPDEKAADILAWTKIDLKYQFYFEALKTLISQIDSNIVSSKADIAANQAYALSTKIQQDSFARAALLEKAEIEKGGETVFRYIIWGAGIFIFFWPALYILIYLVSLVERIFYPEKYKQASVDNSYSQYRDEGYSRVGASAATSYATVRQVIHKTIRRPTHSHHSHEQQQVQPPPTRVEVVEEVEDEKRYGNWGSDNKSSSSRNSGFNGGGATSDW